MKEQTIYLVGFMGAGKTSVGNVLGELTGIPVIDTDIRIEEQEQMAIRDMFTLFGEDHFRKIESQVLRDLKDEMAIVTTGGGIILNPVNREFLKQTGRTVFLQCNPEVVLARVGQDSTRPLIKDKTLEDIQKMYNDRLPLYKECAAFTIDTSQLSIEEAAHEIIRGMKDHSFGYTF